MTRITFAEALADTRDLLERARAGEEIVVTDGETPVLRIMPVPPEVPQRRTFGSWKGRLVEPPGLLDPMTDDELREFWGEDP